MSAVQVADLFARYTRDEKVAFLLHLAHELTMVARDTYDAGTDQVTDAPRLRVINEIQHRILGFLVALAKDDPRRYPDEVLAAIVVDGGGDKGLAPQLEDAVDRVVSKLSARAGGDEKQP